LAIKRRRSGSFSDGLDDSLIDDEDHAAKAPRMEVVEGDDHEAPADSSRYPTSKLGVDSKF
jgi:hypothetical protein